MELVATRAPDTMPKHTNDILNCCIVFVGFGIIHMYVHGVNASQRHGLQNFKSSWHAQIRTCAKQSQAALISLKQACSKTQSSCCWLKRVAAAGDKAYFCKRHEIAAGPGGNAASNSRIGVEANLV
jgi:hypothetical protein